MGFLSRLLNKEKTIVAPETFLIRAPDAPATLKEMAADLTIKAGPDHIEAYKKVFYAVMSTVEPFSPDEVDAMYATIQAENGGVISPHIWLGTLFEQYFADKDCRWPELEEWNAIFAAAEGREVSPDVLTVQKMCTLLKVADIKDALKTMGIPFTARDSKGILIGRLTGVSPQDFAAACPAWEKVEAKRTRDRRHGFAHLLCLTICGRAMSIQSRMAFASHSGVTWEYHPAPEQAAFVKMALEKNPDAIPPFFPGDRTSAVPQFNF